MPNSNIGGGGTSSAASFTLDHAAILALPTTGSLIVAGVPNSVIIPLGLTVYANTVAGAYTNISFPRSVLSLGWGTSGTQIAESCHVSSQEALGIAGSNWVTAGGLTFPATSAAPAVGTNIMPPYLYYTTAPFDSGDPINLGITFTVDVPGYITHFRFFKLGGWAGPHIGKLWLTDETLLASATFSGETDEGWQSQALSAKVLLTPGVQYIVSVYIPDLFILAYRYFPLGTYANPPIRTVANGAVYHVGSAAFPEQVSTTSPYYFVDLTFSPLPMPTYDNLYPSANMGDVVNKDLYLYGRNTGGNFTGGNSANTLVALASYYTLSVS